MNASGASTVAVNTNTANNTPDGMLTIDQLSTDMLLQAQNLGMANTSSGIDATDFTGRFRVQSTLQGVILDNSTGSLTFRTANNLSDTTRLLTTDNQSLTIEMLNADNEDCLHRDCNLRRLQTHQFQTLLAIISRLTSPGEILARANQTNASITTNTEVGTPTRIIEETAFFQTV